MPLTPPQYSCQSQQGRGDWEGGFKREESSLGNIDCPVRSQEQHWGEHQLQGAARTQSETLVPSEGVLDECVSPLRSVSGGAHVHDCELLKQQN